MEVSVVITVRNDRDGLALTLDSLARQSRTPDEIIVVDGGSTDGTTSLLAERSQSTPTLRVIEAPGANIAKGRNIATNAARFPIIATTDTGCRLAPDWLERIIAPFADDPPAEFVAGVYQIEPQSLLEAVVGFGTMRGQLEPFDPTTFNPSARSVAFTKELWRRVGGWPEWLRFSEDTLFDRTVRSLGARWTFAGDAIVHWRPRRSLRAIAKQFFSYGTGRGHTQIDAPSYRYHLRNLAILLATAVAACVTPSVWILFAGAFAYFHVWAFHKLSHRIVRKTGRWAAYVLTPLVMNVVLFSNLAGYLVGSWQRHRTLVRAPELPSARPAPE